MRDIKRELGTKFKESTEELTQVENALKENSRKVELLLDAIDARHRDIVNEKLDRLKAERQLLEEKREHLTGRGGDIDIEKTASEIL